MLEAFGKIFRKAEYIAITVGVFLLILFVALILPNIRLVIEFASLTQTSFSETLLLTFNLAGSLKTNFTVLSALATVLTALLFGINVSMVTYYVREKKRALKKQGVATGTVGLIVGILGIGCASCGSLLVSLIGLGGALAVMPFGGQEFGVLGVLLLLFSVYTLLRTMSKPAVCKV